MSEQNPNPDLNPEYPQFQPIIDQEAPTAEMTNPSTAKPKRRWLKPVLGILAVLLLLGAYFLFAGNTQSYEGKKGVKIPIGKGFSGVINAMKEAGVLDNETTFSALATVTGWRRSMKGGYYEFASGTSNYEMLSRIKNGDQTLLKLTILEGIRPKKFAEILEKKLEIPQAETIAALRDVAFANQLKTDTTHLFGYMMPDTYFVHYGSTAKQVIKRLKRDFDLRFTDEMEAQAKRFNLTVPQVVTLASIVEWEARQNSEKPRIAGVYMNRLIKGMLLQADPTVQYALMMTDGGIMRRLLFRDYQFEHPYNTYIHAGLPPGPLNNPSMNAIKASVNPEKHDFYFFVAKGDGSGTHTFSRTLGEHESSADDYRARMREVRAEQAAKKDSLAKLGQ